MHLQEEADSIVTDNILDSSVGAAAKLSKSLCEMINRLNWRSALTDPIHNWMSWWKLIHEAKVPLKTFLDMIYSKSQTETTEKTKELQKIVVLQTLI